MRLKNWDKGEVHRPFLRKQIPLLDKFLLYTVPGRNITFSGTPST
jgi:lysophospholipid acyltransferase (LPLAT)-like uncharacterized protein